MLALHHKINFAVIGLAPICLMTSQSMLQLPFDLLLGVALPIHGHIGMNQVGTDYVAKVFGKGAIGPFRLAMAGFTGITMLGCVTDRLPPPASRLRG